MRITERKICGLADLYKSYCTRAYITAEQFIRQNAQTLLFLFGIFLLHQGLTDLAYAGRGSYGQACNGLLSLVEGTFGALVTAAAGIGAILASAMGGFKMAWTLVVVAVGAFILRSYITLFNGDCGGGVGGVGVVLPAVGGNAEFNPGIVFGRTF